MARIIIWHTTSTLLRSHADFLQFFFLCFSYYFLFLKYCCHYCFMCLKFNYKLYRDLYKKKKRLIQFYKIIIDNSRRAFHFMVVPNSYNSTCQLYMHIIRLCLEFVSNIFIFNENSNIYQVTLYK